MYFESHAHYDDRRFSKDRHETITALPKAGVDTVINAGSCIPSSFASIDLAKKYDFFYAAVGVHPHHAAEIKPGDMDKLRTLCAHTKTVALGEIGLDYYYDHSPRDVQRKWFETQLALSKEVGLPVIIHSREATQETFDIIENSGVRKGVIHCYSGAKEMAQRYVNLGFYIGIGGVVTFPKAKNLVETVQAVPLSRLLIETDCPYLAPVPFRGERNGSQYLKVICDKIAEIKGVAPDEAAAVTAENGKVLFAII